MRYRIAVNSTRYGFTLDEEIEAADADDLVAKLRDLAAAVVRRGGAAAIPPAFQAAAAAAVESTEPMAFCRYVAQEWSEEHPEAAMRADLAAAGDFVAAAEAAGLLRSEQ
jgi:hypothetical protein